MARSRSTEKDSSAGVMVHTTTVSMFAIKDMEKAVFFGQTEKLTMEITSKTKEQEGEYIAGPTAPFTKVYISKGNDMEMVISLLQTEFAMKGNGCTMFSMGKGN